MTEQQMRIENLKICIRIVNAARLRARTRLQAETEGRVLDGLIAELAVLAPGTTVDLAPAPAREKEHEEAAQGRTRKDSAKEQHKIIQPTLF